MKALYKKIKEKGALFVLTAIALPFFVMLLCFIVDIGILYWEIDRLQAIADAAALAGGQIKVDKYGDTKVLIKIGDENTNDAAEGITHQVVDYIQANGLEVAPAADSLQSDGAPSETKEGMNIDGLALQFTNFTEDGYNTSFLKEKYDGPVLENIPENYGKVAVQCGVPVDAINRVRVRIQKLVPTILVGPVFGMDAWPITVTAAAEPQRKPSNFRIVAMHGLYLNFTDLVSSKINTNVTEGYLDGDVYAGDFLCCTANSSSYVIDTDLPTPTADSHGYGAGAFTMKGNLYVRNVGTGIYGAGINDTQEMFARQKGKYLYWRRYMKDGVESIEYTVNPDGSVTNDKLRNPWEHVYNFNRIMNWERFRIYNEDIHDFMPMEPHKFRLAISTEEERIKFKEASIKVWDERLAYRREMETLYNEALNSLCAVKDEGGNINMVNTMAQKLSNTKTEWRYLYCSNQKTASQYTSISAADNGKTIKLLVEIKGIPTTQVSGYNVNNGGIAYLTNGGLKDITSNLPNGIRTLNIEKMVVVITDRANGVSRPIEENRLNNGQQSSLLVKSASNPVPLTGALFVAPSKKDEYASGYQKISFGDIYSEANLCFEGKELTFNGMIYSEKTINFPATTYDAGTDTDKANVSHHIFSGSATIFGRHVTFGHLYGITGLTAGLDYPIGFFEHSVANVSGSHPGEKNAFGHVPMHYRSFGLTDEEYLAKEFLDEQPADEANDPRNWKVVMSNSRNGYENYNYHWFNPNLEFSFMPEKVAKQFSNRWYKEIENEDGTKSIEYDLRPPTTYDSKTGKYKSVYVFDHHSSLGKDEKNYFMVNNAVNPGTNNWGNYSWDFANPYNEVTGSNPNDANYYRNISDINSVVSKNSGVTYDINLENADSFYSKLYEDYGEDPDEREYLRPFRDNAGNYNIEVNKDTELYKNGVLTDETVANLFATIDTYKNSVKYGPHIIGALLPEKNAGGLGYQFTPMYISTAYPYFANPYLDDSTIKDFKLLVPKNTDRDGYEIANFHSHTYTRNNNITNKGAKINNKVDKGIPLVPTQEGSLEVSDSSEIESSKLTDGYSFYNDNIFYLPFEMPNTDEEYYKNRDEASFRKEYARTWITRAALNLTNPDKPVIKRRNADSGRQYFSLNKYLHISDDSDSYFLNKISTGHVTSSQETGEPDTIPWYRCYTKRYQNYNDMGTLADVNKVYIDMLLLCGGKDPFVYRPGDPDDRNSEQGRVIALLNSDSPKPFASNNIFRPAKTYRYAYDLDMHVKYLIDQINIINNRNGEFAPTAWTDNNAYRTYDLDLVAGAPEGSNFGKVIARYQIPSVKLTKEELEAGMELSTHYRKYMASHVFGLRNDSVYTSIRLVE